jgi:hypothetical protein
MCWKNCKWIQKITSVGSCCFWNEEAMEEGNPFFHQPCTASLVPPVGRAQQGAI